MCPSQAQQRLTDSSQSPALRVCLAKANKVHQLGLHEPLWLPDPAAAAAATAAAAAAAGLHSPCHPAVLDVWHGHL
jgi:hypothetical protein